jgi:transposase
MRRKAALRMGDLLTMSNLELSRHHVMQRLNDKRLTQQEAAAVLGLSTRQVKRLARAFRREGVNGLVSKRRGRPSNHQLPLPSKEQATDLIRQHYHDFGPTLAHAWWPTCVERQDTSAIPTAATCGLSIRPPSPACVAAIFPLHLLLAASALPSRSYNCTL